MKCCNLLSGRNVSVAPVVAAAVLFASAADCLRPSLRAQVVADGETNVLVNVTNTFSGDVTIGTNGPFTSLTLTDNALLSNSGDGIIGRNATARSGEVAIFGNTARWFVGGALFVGSNGALNRLSIENAGRVTSQAGAIGSQASAENNLVVLRGPGSSWTIQNNVDIGNGGPWNRLGIRDGAFVQNLNARMSLQSSSSNNEVRVTGAGSVWSNRGSIFVGIINGGNRLFIENGGQVVSANASYIGGNPTSRDNEVVVSGAGSMWRHGSELSVGSLGPRNRLEISGGGTVSVSNLFVGFSANSLSNSVVVNGGTLRVTNGVGNGTVDVRRGTNVLSAGLIEVDKLLLTNAQGQFQFDGGTLVTRATTNQNGRVFTVGNGVSAAGLHLAGQGHHLFANGLVVRNNALLTGSGRITGNSTVPGSIRAEAGSTIAPGASIGRLLMTDSPVLQGALVMEISKSGTTLTNDQMLVSVGLTYGGTLAVSNVGPTALGADDSFTLFGATTFSGSFSSISLPPLDPGLTWTNRLLVDGSIAVVAVPAPGFASVSLSGTNIIVAGTNGPPNAAYAVLTSTDAALALSSWVSVATNHFGPAGQFSFTNAIDPATPQRFFAIRSP